ncbi:TPA: phosphoribosyltransferase [Candidatus Dependentiae bacterium]|nr:MAG: hypothetical protein US03_C0010G0065 [candidate division TM6 bacterium GW2011_GWF2_36_131]KKQ02750.1 MAG: hypothetical protein US13_C0010G0010 [candidate division TM6 bacterium GW2011_GWE2_36_25]KKQ19153.1 MAG: hypothetical protein US32_C0015G0036 [candidate division TM6 bacterium GW2011_GWA2_36_9]HBR70402.1 phosphoribosyltransferase [Candidatus Dependentiae bacterium]HCU01161.1 phosphoribosyltransferase [Candidatus Dependentiae bacterium]
MFKNRIDAANQLAEKIEHLKKLPQLVVLAVPRGGLPIGAILAQILHAPLDIILTKKIGAPFNPEFAIGAVTPESYFINVQYDNPAYAEYIEQQVPLIQTLLKERAKKYRAGKEPISITGKNVIIADDGVATGRTLLAAVKALKKDKPRTIVIATPVITPEVKKILEEEVEEVISVITPEYLGAIGEFYEDFSQVDDEAAIKILQESRPLA